MNKYSRTTFERQQYLSNKIQYVTMNNRCIGSCPVRNFLCSGLHATTYKEGEGKKMHTYINYERECISTSEQWKQH